MSLSYRADAFRFEEKRRGYGSFLAWRISTGYYIKHFGLKYREADRISQFIYLVNGEEDREFLFAIEAWVREGVLFQGSVQSILDGLTLLTVCRVDSQRVASVKMARREVVLYVRNRLSR